MTLQDFGENVWYKRYFLWKLSGVYLMIYTYKKYFYEKQIEKTARNDEINLLQMEFYWILTW